MSPTLINNVLISTIVYEHLLVHVTDPKLYETTLQYVISPKDSHNVIRKGSFRGQGVQLRVAHMPEGLYNFCLVYEGNEQLIVPFEKKSENFDVVMVSK
jgi:hypothetical protein